MSSPRTTKERELAPELNPLWHVRQLFEKHGTRSGRGPRAERLGVPPHLVNRVFARGERTYRGIPKHATIVAIARVIGCEPNAVLLAFNRDLHPQSRQCVIQEVVDVAVDMSTSQRLLLVKLAKAASRMTQSQGQEVLLYVERVLAEGQ